MADIIDNTDRAAAACAVLGPGRRRPDLPVGHVRGVPGPGVQRAVLAAGGGDYQPQLFVPYAAGRVVVAGPVVPCVCGLDSQGEGEGTKILCRLEICD